ncbi:hypothetical protein [Novosphingobium guangzhouense]|uniref:Addiction module toxin RelE n=1 Tax=Novosphingobium guangzhouense TaxID=1850347 RepID=A0A2K2G0L4_9SPHN|nr:hypothetical protein [Novosphingobium guangzhouense]PNU04599.1 hypothetical protein A8V01_19515 [Novosphingobium guangzhouense]
MSRKNAIVETQAYLKQAERIGISPEDRAAIKLFLAENPNAGDLVQGSGGVRKARYAIGNKGKSGGVRLFTLFWSPDFPVYLLGVIAKSRQGNLTQEQIAVLAQIVKELKNGR